MIKPNIYRTTMCGTLTKHDVNQEVRVAGWVENIRDHGGVIFIDLRDQEGTIQLVSKDNSIFDDLTRESTLTASGKVVNRDKDMINPRLSTGEIEIVVDHIEILSKANNVLPFEVMTSTDVNEELRLKYRFLDLRNQKVHHNIALRSKIINFMRNQMLALGFDEIQTPILTASSPEGARDFIVPSRKHHGKFYALPQAPQIFKQLLMTSGFDKYFQIAPCFRDEDGRKDRSPGEFYQLDFEMAFATQEDVFHVTEQVLTKTFKEFSTKKISSPFVKLTYQEAMTQYGTDKPDLRNPIKLVDLTDLFTETTFKPFQGLTIKGIALNNLASKPNSWFNELVDFAIANGMKGLGYLKVNDDQTFAGPIDKFLTAEDRQNLITRAKLKPGSVLFFIADKEKQIYPLASLIRTELAEKLDLIDTDKFEFCFITDFPMYEFSEEEGKYIFTHNPFTMPQGGLAGLDQEPSAILAYQYDIVCNGIELSSGGVRNHRLDIMKKAFEIAGYGEDEIKKKFNSLHTAFQYGAPPHAGMAPGIDRIIMLITDETSIREVIAFPMNNNAQDLLLGSPGDVSEQQLREVHIKIR